MIRGYRPATAADGPAVVSKAVDPAERADVIQSVAALDQRFQQGGFPTAEYQAQRRELMARVLDPGSNQDGATEGVQPE